MREPLALADDDPTRISPSVEDTALGREEAAALYAELAVLPEKQREALVLRDIYGLRYDEVATALGTSRPAVEALLFRARRRLQRRLRPGLVAGVLVVPLAVQESIAYAVPGFASTAATPVAAAAVGIPLIAKLAAAGAAVGIVGSAGVVAERGLHDPPTRPAGSTVEQVAPVAAKATPKQSTLLPVPAAGFVAVRQVADGGDDGSQSTGGSSAAAAVAVNGDDRNEAEKHDPSENSGSGHQEDTRAEDDSHDSSGHGSGVEVDKPEPELAEPTETDAEQPEAENDNSGPGSRADDSGDEGAKIELDG
jgi:hypothetical protein